MLPTQSKIESTLQKYKAWYLHHYALCVFCGHHFKKNDTIQLAHLIRRSYSSELQTVKLNCGLSHFSCHDIFDNDPGQAIYLPRFIECMYIIWMLDEQYFNQISHNYPQLSDIFSQFNTVPYEKLDHHGELIQLDYMQIRSV